jgi:type I restriction enzyme R subunit
MAWRTIDGVTLDPLGEFNELETLVRGLLAPAYLLDYLRYFVLFEDDGTLVKKIAGYHQFHAVRAAIAAGGHRFAPRRHAQGRRGLAHPGQRQEHHHDLLCRARDAGSAMENPTIVVITDRNDLDGQLFGVFSLAQDLLREQPVQAEQPAGPARLLGNRHRAASSSPPSRSSCPARTRTRFPVLSDRHNIVVIADEAHRTQYGFEAPSSGPSGRPENGRRRCQRFNDANAHRRRARRVV